MKKLKVPLEMFKCEPIFIWNCSADKYINYLNKHYELDETSDWLDGADGTVITTDYDTKKHAGKLRAVWVKTLKYTPEDIGRLSHEITHLCIRILEDKGVPYDSYRNADESLAYMVDFFMRKVLEYNCKK